MEIGLSVIQATNSRSQRSVLVYGQQFWFACTKSIQENTTDAFLVNVVAEYWLGGIEKIMFPVVFRHHWFAICLSFTTCEILFAEGFNAREPPTELCERMLWFLGILGVETRGWRVVREKAPQQCDGWNCGPIALSVMERWYSGKRSEMGDWCAEEERIRYVRRAVEMYYRSGIDEVPGDGDTEEKLGEDKVCFIWFMSLTAAGYGDCGGFQSR